MMSRKLSSVTRYQSLTQSTLATRTIFNTTHGRSSIEREQSIIRRWIFGMLIGSAPFLIILICWMFVSLCINNLVRAYRYRTNRSRRNIQTNNSLNITSKVNI